MEACVIKDSFKSVIIPLPKSYLKAAADYRNTDSDELFDSLPLGMKRFKTLVSGPVLSRDRGWSFEMRIVYCPEHRRPEMIPEDNFFHDLMVWYSIGLHPRFSFLKALIRARQRYTEIDFLIRNVPIAPPSERRTRLMIDALRKSKTMEEFLEKAKPFFLVDLRHRGRTYRVERQFKKRFERKEFTVSDFLREQSQELRRVILRSVPIKDVLQCLRRVSRDKEGTLYDERIDGDRDNVRRHLHVKCPSTGQDYLLEVPMNLRTPREARRWTFNLPKGAGFAKEA